MKRQKGNTDNFRANICLLVCSLIPLRELDYNKSNLLFLLINLLLKVICPIAILAQIIERTEA